MKLSENQRILILANVAILLVAAVTFKSITTIKKDTCFKMSLGNAPLMFVKSGEKKDGKYKVTIFHKKGEKTETVKGEMTVDELKSYEKITCPN